MSIESEQESAGHVLNGCKLIAVMWILIPINRVGVVSGRKKAGHSHIHKQTLAHRCSNISIWSAPDTYITVEYLRCRASRSSSS